MGPMSYDTDAVGVRFNRLIQDVMKGNWQRTQFEPWEIEILLDIQSCADEALQRRDLLPRYQKAVQRQLANRRAMPMKLSEYVAGLKSRRNGRERDGESVNEGSQLISAVS